MTAFSRTALIAPIAALSLAGCGLNSVPTAEENVNAKWADVQSEYQRRSDLIPNLVETVRGYAKQEASVLQQVTEARASAGRVTLSAEDLDDPAKVRAFNEAQNRLTQAIIPLQRLQEAYPDLKSNQNFLTLQSQIEGTENSILVSRRDYNEAVQAYNTRIRTFPDAIGAKIFYGAKPKVPFEAAAGAQEAPKVDFDTTG
ncbi:LemA family protein [Sphingomonas sp. LY29]|uniref:LemA family protein n=1 Tax=unclassified Sphingomonas TaxID=196159 RepID=UPI002ADEF8C6|nr:MULTISPECIES: LemA family protein [unclassified Sphingomonas]MEA1071698.1 LemA family protein [Sphingomonas sp. LY160]WRP25565.1 LemA family protein [Sphingomonas sp. LY29]